MTAVWEQSQTKGSNLLLLLAIADHADDDGFAWPGIKRLAHKTRMTPRHVKRMIASIKDDASELYYEQLEEGYANRYIVLPGLSNEQFAKTLMTRFGKTADEAAQIVSEIRGGDILSPLPRQSRGDKMSPGGDIAMSPEPSLTVMDNNDHHGDLDTLGILPKEEEVPETSPLPAKNGVVYSPIDEDGNDLRDLGTEALLLRIWKATYSSRLASKPDKKYYSKVNEIRRIMSRDKRYAAYLEHQITWSFNDGNQRLSAPKWFDATLDPLGFERWLERQESGELEDDLDTLQIQPKQHRSRRKSSPHITADQKAILKRIEEKEQHDNF